MGGLQKIANPYDCSFPRNGGTQLIYKDLPGGAEASGHGGPDLGSQKSLRGLGSCLRGLTRFKSGPRPVSLRHYQYLTFAFRTLAAPLLTPGSEGAAAGEESDWDILQDAESSGFN